MNWRIVTTQTSRHLLEQAHGLLTLYPKRRPRQTELRRAISASYYSVFHFLLEAAADMHVGAAHSATPRYALAYRSISHQWLRSLCTDIAKPAAPAHLKQFLPSSGFGIDIRSLASGVTYLQERRHAADYDPLARYARGDALVAIRTADNAWRRFTTASLPDRQIFLALLLFPPRGRN